MDLAAKSDYIKIPINDVELDFFKPDPSSTIQTSNNDPIVAICKIPAPSFDEDEAEKVALIETPVPER